MGDFCWSVLAFTMAAVQCRCGGVTINFVNETPKGHAFCCCVDCLQRLYISSNGSLDEGINTLAEVPDLLYLDAQFMKPDENTQQNLGVFKLNKADSPITHVQARCCGTVLFTQHCRVQEPHTVALAQHGLSHNFRSIPEPCLTLWPNMWPVEKRQVLDASLPQAPPFDCTAFGALISIF